MRITVSDVDEASTKMLDLFPSAASQLDLEVLNIASGFVLGLSENATADSPTIASLYDAILQNWIAPLPADIPVPVRQSKERLARRTAAEVILASARIRRIEVPQRLHAQLDPSQDGEATILESSSQPLFPDESLLPPSSSSLGSTERPMAQPPSATVTVDPLTRLSKHLRIDSLQAKPIPASIAQILSHWQPETDPRTYSWEATEEALQEEAEDDEASQQKREKSKRKRERRDRRQKREDDVFKATTVSQPQVLRSSPGPSFGTGMGLGMSSQIPATSQSQSQSQMFGGLGGLGVYSQVEPGRHGGRLLLKKKKGKKRVGGF
jgi:RNA polymerase I-specific transcription initiation factor RRN6